VDDDRLPDQQRRGGQAAAEAALLGRAEAEWAAAGEAPAGDGPPF
jgi:hypothetical protein